MKQGLLKKIVIVVGKLIRSRVLRGGARLRGALRGEDGARKFSTSCKAGRGEDGVRQNLAGRGRKPPPLAPRHPITIPSIFAYGNPNFLTYLRN